ncbi:FAD-binding protein [Roseomonas sp. NAR14]|uniref:FAD-binding protein n=1 Tax=Roseomonas acroporae TaxID=2937791 RepID=A0A9X1Y3B0_9PROT|nr:FAD-binding and (Fe-S)-binding domain-containing protein [Roseomonas acroporae]MCK8783144.1 FAD-binding protein [Roseomonas acroporae]
MNAPPRHPGLPRGRIGDSRLADRLRRETEGEVLFSAGDRGRYSTDASIYQVEPIGVIVPRTTDDVAAAMAIAREEGIPVLPRGGGTSQCGQTVNRALVMDCSKHLRRVTVIDEELRQATVEPGITLGALNESLKPHGLFFPVDPSTWARCTIGGMAGNNSCGAKSIRYGLMADNVLAIDAILADGARFRFGELPDNLGAGVPAGVADLVQRLRAIGAREAAEIAARFPHQLRRVGGYNLDALTPEARAAGRGSLARLLVGSEGTLAYSATLDLKLWPIKPRKVVGICQFPTFRAAMEASRHLVALDPEAVELVDRTMIDLARDIPIFRATIGEMVPGDNGTAPQALLIVEFHGDADAPLAAKLRDLDQAMADLGYPGAVVRATDAAFQARIAEVREAGLNIMMSMKGDGKPVSFIEDCAVGLDDLADYTERLNEVFARHGTVGTWYAHASVGCLHVRPVLNMKDPADVRTMRAVAEECFALVREYKGSHSGEHGDGICRSEFNEPMFGPRIARAFEAVKDAFDPSGMLNPGRVVRPPRMDDRTLFRYFPDYAADPAVRPALDWSAWPGPQGGLLGAVEMCNNNGTCRKFDAGTMCPSYRVTREERHLTRGRANTLRLALTGQLGPDALASDEVAETLKLCVSCKGCRRECPTGVDMAKLKIEAQHARAQRHGVPLGDRLIAELPRYAAAASRLPWLAALRGLAPGLAERVTGLARGRSLPRFRRDFFRDSEAAGRSTGREVILLADTFNRHFEPENLRDALRVLAAAGCRVRVAQAPDRRPLCCGRTYLAAGMVDRARAEARRTLDAIGDGDAPVIGLEPSCLLTLRDEFLSLLPGTAAERLAARAVLLSEFLAREKPDLKLRPLARTAHLHGHCHQKSFGAFPDALSALRRVPELQVKPITSSCCGMAGAFGYRADTQEASRAMAELSLLPAVRAAAPGDLIVADGTSCRHQIDDLGGRAAVHSVRVLAQALEREALP